VSVSLDPHSASSTDISFVSHAHIDHIHTPSANSKIVASDETVLLAKERGFDLGANHKHLDGLQLVENGHILGSRGLLIDGEVYYTGRLRHEVKVIPGRRQSCKV